MGVSIGAVAKGLANRFRNPKETTKFARLSWWQQKVLKHQEDASLKTLAVGSLRILYKRPYELLHTYAELFEDEIYAFPSANPSPLIIDCGANIGLSVLYFKSLYPSAKVIAFEPDGDNMELLKKNIAANNLTDVECRQTAVWTTNGELLFEASGTQGSGIVTDAQLKNVVRMKAERLADLLKGSRIDFLKIDIEGAELDVVRDCAPVLHNVTNLFVEYHGKASESAKLSELLSILKMEFAIYIKMAADSLVHPFVQKKTSGSFDVQLNIFCYRSMPGS